MHHLKIIIRNLRRGGIYSAVNIGGLAVGMAAAILILAWIHHGWMYDRFHPKTKQLYLAFDRATMAGEIHCWEWTPRILAPTLKADYPEIAAVARVDEQTVLYTNQETMLKIHTGFADPDFLSMFDFPLLEGDRLTVLNNPRSVILTQTAAKRLFGDNDPMGMTLKVDNRELVTVAGIMNDMPDNTTFSKIEILASVELSKALWPQSWPGHWGENNTHTFVELHEGASLDAVNQSVRNVINKHLKNTEIELFLYPLSNRYLWSNFENGVPAGGRIDSLRMLGIIAALVLLIACINFTNLSIARSEKRMRETGVRKVFGSSRAALIRLFLSESIATAFIAGIAAIIIASLALPVFGNLMEQRLTLNFASIWFWIFALGFVIFTGLLAGAYPAFFLSSFTPAKTLKGRLITKRTATSPQKVLVTLQFTVATALILATLVIHKQISYAQQRETGYTRNQLISIDIEGDIATNCELIKTELLASGAAISVTKTSADMTEQASQTWGVSWEGKDPAARPVFELYFADGNWAKTVETVIIDGRDINPVIFPTDSMALLLNETAVKTMNLTSPIGQTIQIGSGNLHVVGIFRDFIIGSPYQPVMPMLVGGAGGWFRKIQIKLNGANSTQDNLARITEIFSRYNPAYPLEYKFADDEYARKFGEEQKTATLSDCFAGLTIFISCLGMFALVSNMAETRRKEIGIRKVLGASTRSVVQLISVQFLILVLISVTIALPAAWWIMNRWLASFTWRTGIAWWMFAAVALIILLAALLTVLFQAVNAATANPAKAMKTE